MATVVVNFTNIIRDLGSSAAIIQREEVTEELKRSVLGLNFIFGSLICICIIIFSHTISIFFNELRLVPILIIIAFTFPINSITSIHLALLERESKFQKIGLVEIVSSLVSLFTAIILCISGFGVYSLVVQVVLYSILSAFGFVVSSQWKSAISFNFFAVKELLSFTSGLVAFNFINYFSRNADQIIIGRFSNASTLGQYSLSYRLMLFPVQNITFVLTRSLYPILSRLQNDKNAAFNSYMQVVKAISILTPPLMLGLSSVSVEFVRFFFGPKWDMVPGLIFWLAPVAIMQSFVSTTGSVFMANGKTNVLVSISIYNAILQVGAFIIGGFFGVFWLVKLYFIANVLMFFPNMYLAVKMLHGSFVKFLSVIIIPICCALIMYIIVLFSKIHFLSGVGEVVNLVASILLGVVVYSLLIVLVERKWVMSSLKFKR